MYSQKTTRVETKKVNIEIIGIIQEKLFSLKF